MQNKTNLKIMMQGFEVASLRQDIRYLLRRSFGRIFVFGKFPKILKIFQKNIFPERFATLIY
jgi:hypothetical protein